MAKSVRRDLRRAVGVSVVETVQNLDEAVGTLGTSLNGLRRDFTDLAVDHATFKKYQAENAEVVDAQVYGVIGDASEPLRRPFLGRLRWLLTGK